jgi:alkaline phosphatase D
MGDYIYEYEPGEYHHPELVGVRDHFPPKELIALKDYRRRYYQHRLGPGLRKAHQQHPMIAIWDDHETANDSWMHGAENHDPTTEGDWDERVANALQAYDEWLPIRMRHSSDKEIYRRFKYGDLVDLIMTEARLVGREEQILPKQLGGDLTDEQLMQLFNPDRTLLGEKQFRWLAKRLTGSKAQWKIVGSSVMMMQLFGFGPNGGIGNLDAWDGYPAEREKIFQLIRSYGIENFGVVSGDFHTSFAASLQSYAGVGEPFGLPVGFEFTTPSISAANLNEQEVLPFGGNVYYPLGPPQWEERDPRTLAIEDALSSPLVNPHIKYINLDQHGYMIVGFNKERAQADFYYVDAVLEPALGESFAYGWSVATGTTTPEPAGEMLPRVDQPLPAPENPPQRWRRKR